MASRRPLVTAGGRVQELPSGDSLKVGQASLDASDLTADRTHKLPDANGTLALAGIPVSQQSGTTYTLAASDAGTIVQRTSATLNKVYVDASVFDLSNGPVVILLQQVGAGLMSTDPFDGSTTMNKGGMTASAYQRGSMMYVIVDSSSSFYVGGEVKFL